MAMRPLDSARLREIARDVEKILSNYDRLDSEADYDAFFKGVVAWRKENLDKGGYRDLMKYLRDRIEFTAADPDRQMDVFRKKVKPLFDLTMEISPPTDYSIWLKRRAQWKQKVTEALNGLPEVGAWLDRLRKDKKRDLKPAFEVPSETNMSLDGFHMILHEYDEENPKHRAFVADLAEAIKDYQRRAKRYFPEMLRHRLPMDVMFGEGHSSGNYGDGRILLHQKSMRNRAHIVYTIAHETGHYFGLDWMSQRARAFWIAVIKQDMKPIKLSELLAKWPANAPEFMTWLRDAKETDPLLGMQLQAIWDDHVHMPKEFVKADNWTLTGLEEYLKAYGDSELRILHTPITPYANSNPDEAFAEAIALLIAYGPQAIHAQVREWLQIVLPGEIRLAAITALKVAARYHQAPISVSQ